MEAPFRYWSSAPFLGGCAAFACHRWLLRSPSEGIFMRDHFNDLWMIPCALPPLLWLYRRLGLRTHDRPPEIGEVAFHLVFWSVFCEWAGPHLAARSTGDPWDVAAYAAGALGACLWWRRRALFPRSTSAHEL